MKDIVQKLIYKFGEPGDYEIENCLYIEASQRFGLFTKPLAEIKEMKPFIVSNIPYEIKNRKDFYIIFDNNKGYDGRILLDLIKILSPYEYGFSYKYKPPALVLKCGDDLYIGIASKDPNPILIDKEGNLLKVDIFNMENDVSSMEENERFFYNAKFLLEKDDVDVLEA